MISTHTALQAACLFYGLAFIASLTTLQHRRVLIAALLIPGLAACLLIIALRYHQAWPMLPLHLTPVAVLLCLGLLYPIAVKAAEPAFQQPVQRSLLAAMVLVAACTLCFPKDFYLPFVKSKTLFAHAFLVFGAIGKACFLISAGWALAALMQARRGHGTFHLHRAMHRCHFWTVWGFALWTVSMFSGGLWSYFGWGTPVVWEDAAILTTMSAWFFYACFLHLHLTRSWTLTGRAACAVIGGLVVLALTFLPDLGPFRNPLLP